MSRILFLGDTAGTGFGTVTRDLASELIKLGEDIRIVSMNEDASYVHDPAFPDELKSRTILLGNKDGWLELALMDDQGQQARTRVINQAKSLITEGVDGWKPECVLMVGDVASVRMSPWRRFIPPGMPAFHYVPIEGIGLPPRFAEVWSNMQPVACSEFGADQIATIYPERPPVIYHGIDPEAFYPVSNAHPIVLSIANVMHVLRNRDDCRKFLGWPLQDTILFRCDRHMPRKNYASLLRCVAPVIANRPKVRLIWHCRTIDQGGDLQDERSKYPLALQARMNSTGSHDAIGGVDRKVLCAMYNAADIYVSTSAEGFGLTVAEALSCGTPAIGLDYSSVPEVIGPAGVTVPVTLIDNIYSHFWAIPREPEYTTALDALVRDTRRTAILGMKGPGHVKKFSWATAARQFSDLIAQRTAVAA